MKVLAYPLIRGDGGLVTLYRCEEVASMGEAVWWVHVRVCLAARMDNTTITGGGCGWRTGWPLQRLQL